MTFEPEPWILDIRLPGVTAGSGNLYDCPFFIALPPRTIIYVDGFNFYYGALRGTPFKWLDLQRYFQLLRPGDQILHVRYFTALVHGPTRPNQVSYLRALSTLPLVAVVLGKFKNKSVPCRNVACTYAGNRFFPMPEEKRTDVNIAVHMLDDAYQNHCDNFVLVSGDSDLVPVVKMLKTRFPAKRVTVYVPTRNPIRGAAVELRSVADKHRDLPLNLLQFAQLPSPLPDGAGGFIHKPAAW